MLKAEEELIKELWSQIDTLKRIIKKQSSDVARKTKAHNKEVRAVRAYARQIDYELEAAWAEVDRLKKHIEKMTEGNK